MQFRIAVIPGDGTGPEVAREGIKVLEAAASGTDLELTFVSYDFGGNRYLRTGELLPDSAVEEIRGFDAIYLGAIGHPDVTPGVLEKGILLRLRFELEQYINLRPVKLYANVETPLKDKGPSDIDFVVVRENCGGVYTGLGEVTNKGLPDERATQIMAYTRPEVDRCLRYAFDLTRERDSDRQLTLCGKTNVLTNVYGLWERAFHEMGEADYPDIKREYAHIDATVMWMIKNPEWFDVIVTGNMFGDIITDLGAMIQGGMGIAAGGQHQPRRSLHVRADRRLHSEIHRNEHRQSDGRHRGGADDVGAPGSEGSRDADRGRCGEFPSERKAGRSIRPGRRGEWTGHRWHR